MDDPVSSYAIGVIKGNQLVLVPLDFTLQLRPNMSYLNPGEQAVTCCYNYNCYNYEYYNYYTILL